MTATPPAALTTVLAELTLTILRKSLPTPRYMTMSDGEPFKQISLSLGNRSELDEWNAAFGNAAVTECPPRADAQDVLVTTMHGGVLLGWTVNLQTRVPAPPSAELLAALGEAARSDALAVTADAASIVAESLAEPKQWRDRDGKVWRENTHGRIALVVAGDSPGVLWHISDVEARWGPLVEVQRDAAVIVAESLTEPRRWRDREGDEWEESGDRLRLAEPGVVSTTDRAFVENAYGPLVEVRPDAEVQP